MYILGVESSAVSAGAAVLKDGRVVGETYVNSGLTHSQTLLPLIDSCLASLSLTVDDMDILAVAAGPGSFTGVRIGVSTVKGLAFPGDKPCYGVSTLEAMAYCAALPGFIICPVMDARRSQVYNALFERVGGEIVRLTPDRALSLEELGKELAGFDRPALLVGDGSELTEKYLSGVGADFAVAPEIFRYQRASGVAIAAQRLYNSGVKPVSGAQLAPEYLRLSQAERELKNKKGELI